MPYNSGDEKKYFPAIIAALIVIVGAIGYFFWSLLNPANIGFEETAVVVEDENGTVYVNPGDGNLPDTPPFVPDPMSPPPVN